MLVRAFSCGRDTDSFTKIEKDYFLDVSETNEFSPYINYAIKQGWVAGYKG